jgi:hypothetical protein
VYGTLYQPSDSAIPPARNESNTAWTDANNNLWLFGGAENGALEDLNDIWRYSVANGQWTWMGGTQQTDGPAHYGTLGVESAQNVPNGRCVYTHWTNGNYLYLTGGLDDMFPDLYNDVWRFNLVTGNWTWIAGDNGVGTGFYEGYCDTNILIKPQGRTEQRAAQTSGCTAGLFMWGGQGYSVSQGIGYLNDLWKFDLGSNKWQWISGAEELDAGGVFNTKGVASPGNMPPGASGPCFWGGSGGQLWLWGGMVGTGKMANAMWKYIPDGICFSIDTGSNDLTYTLSSPLICQGDSALLTLSGDSAVSISPALYTNWLDSAHVTLKPDTSTSFAISGYSTCGLYYTDTFTLLVKTDSIAFASSKSAICNGDSALLSFAADSGLSISPLNGVSWSDSLHVILSPDASTLYTITGYSACGSYNTQLFNLQVYPGSLSISSNKQMMCPGDTAQICAPAGLTNYSWNTGDTTTCINATSAGNYYVTVTANGNCEAISNHISISTYPSTTVETNVTGDTLRGFNAVTYQWLLNDVAINGATASIYIAERSGSYTLQITDSFGCIENSNPIIISGINNILSQTSITVFPNPTSTGWQLNVSAEWIGSIAEIFDATGRSVFKSTITNQHSMIEIAGIANGVYELILSQPRTGSGSKTQDSTGYSAVKKLVKM